jgi:glucan 1,3-beta-glucosidase
MPLRLAKVFVSNATGAKAYRPGFRFPRFDARMQHGDEVQLRGPDWLSLMIDPDSLHGYVNMKGRISGHFCTVVRSEIVCDGSSQSGDQFFLRPVALKPGEQPHRLLNRVVSISVRDKLCSDEPDGVRCDGLGAHALTDRERFELVDAGDGAIQLKGGRSSEFCALHRAVLTCRYSESEALSKGGVLDLFEANSLGRRLNNPVLPRQLRLVLAQTSDPRRASTFVVGRHGTGDGAITLQCKGHSGRYLAVDPADGVVNCLSGAPARLQYHRVDGQVWWNYAAGSFKDPQTGKYFRALPRDKGGSVKADGTAPGGWESFRVFLRAGYESVLPLVRGVNLGNWFLLEKWMSAELFHTDSGTPFQDSCAAMDEQGLMAHLSPATRRKRMERHWDTWITERDIAWIANHGINTVRVPFGYWMTHPDDPFIAGQFKYLERLFSWCEYHSVAVLLDFHGLKGSQQGEQTSGNCGACGQSRCGETWIRFMEHQETNLAVIANLSAHFSQSPMYLGFGVANEVGGTGSHEVMKFYQRAFDIIRSHSPNALVVLSATFNPMTYPFAREDKMAQDSHYYFRAFEGGARRENSENLASARSKLLGIEAARWPVIVGEWSLGGHGMDLNGQTADELDPWYKDFAKAQLQAWEQHSMGWVYWNYKVGQPGSPWSYRDMCERGRLPGCLPNSTVAFATNDWWNQHPCSFAYLDGAFMGLDCRDRTLVV